MTTIIIPSANWTERLATAIEQSNPGDVVVVDTESKKTLAERAAKRMGKEIEVQVKENDLWAD